MAQKYVKIELYEHAIKLAGMALQYDWIGPHDGTDGHKTSLMKSIEQEIEKHKQ